MYVTLRSSTCFHTFSNYELNAQFLYSSTICMLHYDPQHIFTLFQITNLIHNSFILQQYVCYTTLLNMFRAAPSLLILRRTNCITTASGIVTLCKQPYSMPVESGDARSEETSNYRIEVFLNIL